MDEKNRKQTEQKIDWLNQYRRAVRRMELTGLALEEAREAVQRMTPVLDGLPRPSGHSDKTARAAERLAAAEQAHTAAVLDCRQARSRVQWSISTLYDPTEQELLRRRYLLGQTLTQISQQMHLEYRWLRRLHRRAVSHAVTRLPAPL